MNALEVVTVHAELRVRCSVQRGLLGATFSVRVGGTVVAAGYRFTTARAWRTVQRLVDQLTVDGEHVQVEP